jgi:multidrug efflux pump subunit AcrA (membrane-fusion protein)
MQSHDPENESHSQYPDQVSRTEHHEVSTSFAPETAQRTKRAVGIGVTILLVGFIAVLGVRFFHAHAVAKAGETAYSAPPPVDIVVARPATAGQDLVLPGETAAWFETTIYARVNGYVAKWLVDIGDHVKKGQVLATIETPELDAELEAARAQLRSSQAQVGARKAEAEFSKSTNERCPSKSASRRKRITKVLRRASLQPTHRSIWTNPRSINTTHWPNSKR